MESDKPHPLLTFFEVKPSRWNMGAHYAAPNPSTDDSYSEAKLKISASGGYSEDYWPDILILHGDSRFVLSERVIITMTEQNFTGFAAYPTTITEIKTDKEMKSVPPRYFLLEATSTIDVALERLNDYCVMPKLETWDGSDFVRGNGSILCTRRFIELVGANRWQNFLFGGQIPADLFSVIDYDGNPFDPDWFRAVELKVRRKHYPFFGISEEEAEILFPKPPPGPTFEERLLNPRFDLVEAHFKCKVPQPLRALYENRKKLLRENFVVDIPLPEQIDVDRIGIDFFLPIEEDSVDFSRSFALEESYIDFASDGGEGHYIINPTKPDPEVYLFVMDGSDLYPLGVSLSEFLAAHWYPNDYQDD